MHVSLSFLYSTTLASALYLVLLRYLGRQYRAVVQLVDTVASDTDLTPEEANSLQFMANARNSEDCHPDAHACRLKIALVMLDSPVVLPWDLSGEMSSYVRKLQHVSANCRLAREQELALLSHCVCDPADHRYDEAVHTHYSVLLCKNRRAALRAIGRGEAECAIELPARPEEWRWCYHWHRGVLDVTPAQMEQLLGEVAQKYSHTRTMQLDGMLSLLATLNTKGALPAGISIASGGFLILYNMLQGSTQCRVSSSNSSQSFATLLLPFFPELKEPSLLGSLLLTLARRPLLGPFLPEFVDTRKYKRRDVFTGLPLPDEAEAPLGRLLTDVVRELHDLGGPPRQRDEVMRTMLQRRVDALTKERMWGGWGGGWGDAGWGGGWGGFGGFGGGGGWGQNSYARMEELAVETERQCAEELHDLSEWRSLEHLTPPTARWPESETAYALPEAERTRELPCTLEVSDHSCESRSMRPVDSCPEVVYASGVGAFNTSCPISLADFDEGEKVRRLPGGHLIAAECFEQLLDAARREGKPPTCPFTRAEFAPGVTYAQLAHFCTMPLDVIGLGGVVHRFGRDEDAKVSGPRLSNGAADALEDYGGGVSNGGGVANGEGIANGVAQPSALRREASAIGFDVSTHPDARSKVARDMLARLAADAEEHARQLASSTSPRCLFVLDASKLVYGGANDGVGFGANLAACAEAEAELKRLIATLSEQRDRDAAYVREALPQILRRANAIDLEGAPREARRDRELFSLRQAAEQEATLSLDFMFCLLISTRDRHDLTKVNPFLAAHECDGLLDLVVCSILHASRVGQINRCLSEATGCSSCCGPRAAPLGPRARPSARRPAPSPSRRRRWPSCCSRSATTCRRRAAVAATAAATAAAATAAAAMAAAMAATAMAATAMVAALAPTTLASCCSSSRTTWCCASRRCSSCTSSLATCARGAPSSSRC